MAVIGKEVVTSVMQPVQIERINIMKIKEEVKGYEDQFEVPLSEHILEDSFIRKFGIKTKVRTILVALVLLLEHVESFTIVPPCK